MPYTSNYHVYNVSIPIEATQGQRRFARVELRIRNASTNLDVATMRGATDDYWNTARSFARAGAMAAALEDAAKYLDELADQLERNQPPSETPAADNTNWINDLRGRAQDYRNTINLPVDAPVQ